MRCDRDATAARDARTSVRPDSGRNRKAVPEYTNPAQSDRVAARSASIHDWKGSQGPGRYGASARSNSSARTYIPQNTRKIGPPSADADSASSASLRRATASGIGTDRVVPNSPDRFQYGVLQTENNRHRPATARWHLVPQRTLRVAYLSFSGQMANFRHCRRFIDRDESGRMPTEPPDSIRRTLRSCAIQGGTFRCRQMQFADSTAAI